MRAWHCIQTKSKGEYLVKAKLLSQGYDIYLPEKLIDKRIKQNTSHKTEPLWPGYLFIHMLEGTDDFYPVTNTVGVSRVVKMSEREDGYLYPTMIPDEIIEGLMALEDEEGVHSSHQTDYTKGDAVRVVRGVFKDFPANISTMNKEERVKVLLNIFNQTKEIELDYRDIEPVK